MMTLRFRDETRVPALAIAAYVSEHGAVYSAEILDRFQLSASTLRRRRPELHRLGLIFVERGRGSFYVAPQLAGLLLTSYQPKRVFSARENGA
jgi:DNA-binding IclR family transcriptional regulator